MANTTRQNIFSTVESIISDLINIKYVELDRMSQSDPEIVPLPCVFIYQGPEVRITEGGVIGEETWEMDLILEVWSDIKKHDLEDLLNDIHTTMFSNERIGNYADYSYRTSVEFFYIDPEKQLKGMLITYRIRYSHTKGVM